MRPPPQIWVIPCTTRGCRFESGWGARFNSGTSDDQNLGEDEPHGRWRCGAAITAKTLKLSLHAACCHTLSRYMVFGDVWLTPTPSLASCQARARRHGGMIDICGMQLFAASTERRISSCTRFPGEPAWPKHCIGDVLMVPVLCRETPHIRSVMVSIHGHQIPAGFQKKTLSQDPRETTPASSGSKNKFTRCRTAAQLVTTTAATTFAALVKRIKHTLPPRGVPHHGAPHEA